VSTSSHDDLAARLNVDRYAAVARVARHELTISKVRRQAASIVANDNTHINRSRPLLTIEFDFRDQLASQKVEVLSLPCNRTKVCIRCS
jgi:hypothetical protein